MLLKDPEDLDRRERFERAKEKEIEEIKGYISRTAVDFSIKSGLEIYDRRTDLIARLYLKNISDINPAAKVIRANSPVFVPDGKEIANKKVLVIEDGPTLTHGGMPYGAGIIAANQHRASKIIDPRPFAVGSIKETFQKFSHLDKVLPAMGYGKEQIAELAQTINKAECDLIISGSCYPLFLGVVGQIFVMNYHVVNALAVTSLVFSLS